MAVKEQTINKLAIAGLLKENETKLGISGMLVELSNMPDKYKSWLNLHALQYGESWETMLKRPDRTLSNMDGSFSFINLPNGHYELTIYLVNLAIRHRKQLNKKLCKSRFSFDIELKDNKDDWYDVNILLPKSGTGITGNNYEQLVKADVQIITQTRIKLKCS